MNREQRDKLLAARDMDGLLVAQGFDRLAAAPIPIDVRPNTAAPEQTLQIAPIAEKRGFVVAICETPGAIALSTQQTNRLVRQFAHLHHEHLLILCGKDDNGGEVQKWLVSIRPQNRPLKMVQVEWRQNGATQLLHEKLEGLVFPLQEEKNLTIVAVVNRVRHAFSDSSERVTRAFYGEFQKQLETFARFVEGIANLADARLFAALMLNRLMFIWFIQKKQFLAGDADYLQNRLAQTQAEYGKGEFHNKFYRHFLRRLFADGLNTPPQKRDPEVSKRLGRVPYLNGGLFDPSQLEIDNDDIQIPDDAFVQLFEFFGKYNWRLDARPGAAANEINPDILGYIFEKYINDRAKLGAYYTQEDITDYIARNTILPHLLQKASTDCANAFRPDGIWRALREDPDAFIHPALSRGADISETELPDHIRQGLDEDGPDLAARRKHWNGQPPANFTLATETWRECVSRHKRYRQLREDMQEDAVNTIQQLVARNLDIRAFVQHAIREYEGSDFIAALFRAIAGVRHTWAKNTNEQPKPGIKVLDPACGSGAFLFAAAALLEDLYALCLDRMEEFVRQDDARLAKLRAQKDGKKGGKTPAREKHPLFRQVLAEIAQHPNRDYWICKNIILENLYGVDIMSEAAEIAKLRLFLKLAAVAKYDPADDNLGLRPLPDVDYNIRAGNALVGFASMANFEHVVKEGLDLDVELTQKIRAHAQKVSMANAAFKRAQENGAGGYVDAKRALAAELQKLNDELNRYLAQKSYEIDPAKKKDRAKFAAFLKSHQPFHWLAEFYDIIETNGGFDVIIGNPPYVEYRKVKERYRVLDYVAGENTNIYAFFIEQATGLLKESGYAGMIVPISLPSTPRMQPVRELLQNNSQALFVSNFADRPSTLFLGVHQKNTILLQQKGAGPAPIHTTAFYRWNANGREFLFDDVDYVCPPIAAMQGEWKKFGTPIEGEIWQQIAAQQTPLSDLIEKADEGERRVFINKRLMHWVKCSLLPQKSNEFRGYRVKPPFTAPQIMALLNSSLFFWLWETIGDGWDLTKRELNAFMVNADALAADRKALAKLGKALNADLEKKKVYVGTVQTDYEYKHKLSKPIIDEIDAVLARHYDLTPAQLDFIQNYTIKYRTGGPAE